MNESKLFVNKIIVIWPSRETAETISIILFSVKDNKCMDLVSCTSGSLTSKVITVSFICIPCIWRCALQRNYSFLQIKCEMLAFSEPSADSFLIKHCLARWSRHTVTSCKLAALGIVEMTGSGRIKSGQIKFFFFFNPFNFFRVFQCGVTFRQSVDGNRTQKNFRHYVKQINRNKSSWLEEEFTAFWMQQFVQRGGTFVFLDPQSLTWEEEPGGYFRKHV